jgi:hypothetical protein
MLVKQKEPSHMFVVKLGMVSNLTLNIQVSNCHVLSSAAEPGPPIKPKMGLHAVPCSRAAKKKNYWLVDNSINQLYSEMRFLVGGFNHLEKYEFVNGKDYSIYYMENKKNV